MACDAQSIQNSIASNGLDKLSERDLLICLAGKLGALASLASATTAVAQAYSNGLPKLSDRDLLICLASVFGTNAGFANAQAAVTQATSNGMKKLSDRELWAAFMAVVCP